MLCAIFLLLYAIFVLYFLPKGFLESKNDFFGGVSVIKKELWKYTRNVILVVVGTLILSFGTAVFILPFDLVTGGMSGLAIVIDAIIPSEFLTVDRIIALLTWVLFLVGFAIFGKAFAAKTFLSAILYPMGITLFLKLTDPSVLGGVFCLQASEYKELPLILAATTGGALVGIGCAITFLSGGSTGGTDILAFILCKIFKRLKSSTAIFLIDVTIILLGVILSRNLIHSLLGILSAMITAAVIDKIFLGGTSALVAQIVTERAEEINQGVIDLMERSTTIFEATGGYSKRKKQMITVSFSMRQYTLLMDIVHRADPVAFVTVWRAHEIRGEGWTR